MLHENQNSFMAECHFNRLLWSKWNHFYRRERRRQRKEKCRHVRIQKQIDKIVSKL